MTNGSKTAYTQLKKASSSRHLLLLTSVVAGTALGIVFDQLILCLSIALAIAIAFVLINENNNI